MCDEIYRDLAHDPERVRAAPPRLLPERTFVTNGLSKRMALGGWRIGFARLPDGPAGRARRRGDQRPGERDLVGARRADAARGRLRARRAPRGASSTSTRSRRLHRAVTTAAYDVVVAAGAQCRPPCGAFYLYPELEPLGPLPLG